MLKSKRFSVPLLLIVTGLFFYGMTKLLILRFEKGDVYPPYSSFRSDPLGAKAFFEALRLLPGIETMRNIEPLRNASGLSESTFLLFGLRKYHFSEMEQDSAKALDDVALGGGRIVISFFPVKAQPAPCSEDKRKKDPQLKENSNKEKDEEKDQEEEQKLYRKQYVDLSKQWGVETEILGEEKTEASLSAPEEGLPASLPWHSALFFEPQADAWRTLYARAGKPVLIERSYGKGSIVLSSDSFFLSNEAMKSGRYPRLLSWLCGTHRKIVFDETHLGVSKSPGITTLLRKYGLVPFFVSLIILALLAIWKQTARLVPVHEEEEALSADPGKDTSTGFTNLLHRNISPDYILSACLEEWKRSFTHGKQNLSALLPRIQEIIAADRARSKRNRNPAQAYREISALGRRR